MKNLFILFFLIASYTFSYAQAYDPSKIDKKALQFYALAIEKAEEGNYPQSIEALHKSIEADTRYVEAYLSLAGVYGQMKNYGNSVEFYEKAFSIDPNYTSEYKLPYSINLAGLGRFSDALSTINELLKDTIIKNPNTLKAADYRKKTYEFAVTFEKKNANKQYAFSPVNAGPGINSKESEYFPSLTIDGSELVFTRRVNNFNEDFYSSRRNDTSWQTSAPLPGNINTDQNEGAQMISQDGQWLVFTGCNRRDGLGSCDIYISYRTTNGWSEAINLGGHINSEDWDSQPSLSPDKRELYFASRRMGGYGGSDIYVSKMQPNGRWGEAENLGPEINTKGDESSPFIHADNETLYFTSNGLPGYGDQDIFLIRKGPNGVWSNPENLGYPINTINTEGTLFITSDGSTAYYASDRSDTYGGLDIYTFTMRDDIRPRKTLWVSGKVFDKQTTKGLPSAVELIDLSSKQTVSKIQTDEEGNYLVTLPIGKNYAFNVTRKGYLFYSDNFLLVENIADSIFKKDIPLQPLEANASIVLSNIFFDVNKYELKETSQVELDKLAELLNENPSLKIEISGHTDNIGKPTDNLTLSNNRAKSVVNYLVSKGIAAVRLSYKGFGETQPKADNISEEGRSRNRRTEMKVISK
ncbi:MAG: OmpA family protein [Chitinophagaceae bacterium]|nr:OmpA family protein [Chitinophagaceae bacterium]